MGGVWLVNWCICGPTCKALKTRIVPDRICFKKNSRKKVLVLLSASVERFDVSRMQTFCCRRCPSILCSTLTPWPLPWPWPSFWKSKFCHEIIFVTAGYITKKKLKMYILEFFFPSSSNLPSIWIIPIHYKPFVLPLILFTRY